VSFYVYLPASKRNGTLYIGHTEELINRVREHKDHVRKGFTHKYGVTMLVWYGGVRDPQGGVHLRAPDEEVEPSVEDRADRALQPQLG
jgi:putative endonuclease